MLDSSPPPGTGTLRRNLYSPEAADRTMREQAQTDLKAAAERIANHVSTGEEEQEKNPYLIFRSMQTINDGEWIKSPPEGAGNARQLGSVDRMNC